MEQQLTHTIVMFEMMITQRNYPKFLQCFAAVGSEIQRAPAQQEVLLRFTLEYLG